MYSTKASEGEFKLALTKYDGYGNPIMSIEAEGPVIGQILEGMKNVIESINSKSDITKIGDGSAESAIKFKNGMTKKKFVEMACAFQTSEVVNNADWAALGHKLIMMEMIEPMEFSAFIRGAESMVFGGERVISSSSLSKLSTNDYFASNMKKEWSVDDYKKALKRKILNKKDENRWNKMVECEEFVKEWIEQDDSVSP